jgi:putative inorganic carbon (hco3(-)) transporter
LGSIELVKKTTCIRESSAVTTNWKADAAIALVAVLTIAGMAFVQPLSVGVALAAVLVITVLGVYSPLGLLLAVIVLLPYFYRPIEVSSLRIASSELLLLCLIPATALRLTYAILTNRATMGETLRLSINVMRERQVQVLVVLSVVGAALLMTVDDSLARGAGFREWRWTLLLPLVFVTFLSLFAHSKMARKLLVVSLAAAGLLASLHGVLDVITDAGVQADSVRRISGPLPHPNALALFLVRPLVLAIALSVLLPRWRPLMIPLALVTGVATLGTFSRGALIAILAALAILAFQAQRRVRYLAGASTAAVLGMMFALAGERMRSAFEGGSVSLRLDIWSASMRMIRDNPVSGYGPDQFLYTYSPRYILPGAWNERFTAHAHNLIADSWIRLGIIGAVIAIGVFAVVIVRLFQSRRYAMDLDEFRYPALVAFAAVLVHGLIDNAYFSHDLAMSFWLLLWLAFYRPCLESEKRIG